MTILTKQETIANRYLILDRLGAGGSAITYKALNLETNRQVALKALSLGELEDIKKVELFQREAETLQQLSHPAIPQYLDCFTIDTEKDRTFYLVQELAEGQSLATLVEQGWRGTEREIKDIAGQVLKILIYLHAQHPTVIHRDLTPGNIIRGADGGIFLVDFGAVQHSYYTTLMRGSTAVGTLGYAAPEQWTSKAIPATDLYSLAATLLYLLTHRNPGDMCPDGLRIEFREQVNISEGLANWLEKMLQPAAEDRFASARESLTALGRSQCIVPLPPGEWKGWLQGWTTLLGVGVAGFVVVAGLNAYKWTFLSRLGYDPYGLCEVNSTIVSFFKQGGSFPGSQSCLLWSVSQGQKEIVELLVAKGVDIHARDNSGNTPLHLAAYKGNQEIVKLLVAKGADINARDNFGKTPLHQVVYIENKEIVELLVVLEADINARDNYKETPLHLAAGAGNQEIVELFVALEADINAQNNYKETPLHLAVYIENKEIVKLLVAKGADLNAQNNYNRTPLHQAVYIENKEIVELFVAKGADLNARDDSGEIPLHLAAKNAPQEIVELFIAKGADINARDNSGETPLHLAAKNAPQEIVELFIAKGADINARDNSGTTPLHAAVDGAGNKEIVELFIALGADINARDNSNRTPLHEAAIKSNQEIVKLLLALGADLNARDNSGTTPLHEAAMRDHKEIVELLVALGADVNAKTNRGETPLSYAKKNRNLEIVKLLQQQGAKK